MHRFQMTVAALVLLSLLSGCGSKSSDQAASDDSRTVANDDSDQDIAANFTLVPYADKLHNAGVRDSNDVIWEVSPFNTTVRDMARACEEFGDRLPTLAELEGLTRSLGLGSRIGYHPETSIASHPEVQLDLRDRVLIASDSLQGVGLVAIDGNTGAVVSFSGEDETAMKADALCVISADN